LASVLDELEDVAGPKPSTIDVEGLRRLKRLEWAVQESERLRPATTVLSRYTTQPYEICGYRVPRGWLTFVSPAVSQRLPQSFTNPDAYDPERFAPARAGDRRDADAMLTFGGGLHRCLGMSFARSEIKVVLSLLLGHYRLELVGPEPRADYSQGVTRPTTPTLIRYRRR
jgi:sterol 14-demethylase